MTMFLHHRTRLKHSSSSNPFNTHPAPCRPHPHPHPHPHPNTHIGFQLHPALRLLSAPTHLLLQLIKLTTVPYMLCQILNHQHQIKNQNHNHSHGQNQNQSHQALPQVATTIEAQSSNSPPSPPRSRSVLSWHFFSNRPLVFHPHLSRLRLSHTLATPSSRQLSVSRLTDPHRAHPTSLADPFQSRLKATILFHALLRRDPPDIGLLISLLDRLLSHPAPPRLHSKTLDLLFFHTRPALIDRLLPVTLLPVVPASVAWQAEAMAQIVDRWRRVHLSTHRSRPSNSLPVPEAPVDHEVLARRRLDRIEARRHAFLAANPPTCDCQRPRMPAAPLRMDQVGSLHDSLLGRFILCHARSLSTLTWLRLVDAARKARRWDIAVLCLDRVRLGPADAPQLASRRLGQTTALLSFLRADGRRVPETDPQRLWCVHFVCESIERGVAGAPGEWARVNRLALDVLTRFASMPVAGHGRKSRAPTRPRRPLLHPSRHRRLLAAAATSDVLALAVATRERCERLLSRLARPVAEAWAARSAPQLRLLEHLARQGTEQQFRTLLSRHLTDHRPGAKLARTVLIAARRFDALAANETLVHECLGALAESADTRPAVDFLLRPAQPPSTLARHLAICLGALPPRGPARMAFYGHLLFRLSQLRSPTLALRVWTQIDRERGQVRVRVGRRTRRRAGLVVRPQNRLSAQLARSMVYVYRNLTRGRPHGPARGPWYGGMYKRLGLRASGRGRRWPVSREHARKRLVGQLVADGLARVDGELWRALERAGVERERTLRAPGSERVAAKAIALGRADRRMREWVRSRGGEREKWTREVGIIGASGFARTVAGKKTKGCSRYWARIVAES